MNLSKKLLGLSRRHRTDRAAQLRVLFSPSWYSKQIGESVDRQSNLLRHYLDVGWRDNLSPHPLFDPMRYTSSLRQADKTTCPLLHFIDGGWLQSVSPHRLFDMQWYRARYEDVRTAGVNPLIHYLEHGWKEGRDPHPLFATNWYKAQYGIGDLEPLTHYLVEGWQAGYDPHPLFSEAWLRSLNNPSSLGSGCPLIKYVADGRESNLRPHALFDNVWYVGAYSSMLEAEENPLSHYLLTGWQRGCQPHQMFDGNWYLGQNPDVAAAGVNPLVHYVTQGHKEGRQPHPLFDGAWYLEHNSDVAKCEMEPLGHFVTSGWTQGRNPCPYFDLGWYNEKHPDVAAAAVNPVAHYYCTAHVEERQPHPLFDPQWYLSHGLGGYAPAPDPLSDYIHNGIVRGRSPSPRFGAVLRSVGHRTASAPDRVTVSRAFSFSVSNPDILEAGSASSHILTTRYDVVKAFDGEAGAVCVLAAYAAHGNIPPTTAHLCRAIRSLGIKILLILSVDRGHTFAGIDLDGVDGLIIRENKGFDFANWALALTVFPILWHATVVLFANDSIVGPIARETLQRVWGRLLQSNANCVALTESYQVKRHFQSYFFALKARALQSDGIRQFWASVQCLDNKDAVISAYELTQLDRYDTAGMRTEILFPAATIDAVGDFNPTLHRWRQLVDKGFPFLKVQLLRDELIGVDSSGWQRVLSSNEELFRLVRDWQEKRFTRNESQPLTVSRTA